MRNLMTAEEEEALFEQRVKKINRDCLRTFMPYIKMFAALGLAIGGTFIAVTIYFYQEGREDTRLLMLMTAGNKGELVSIKRVQDRHGKDIDIIQKKVFK